MSDHHSYYPHSQSNIGTPADLAQFNQNYLQQVSNDAKDKSPLGQPDHHADFPFNPSGSYQNAALQSLNANESNGQSHVHARKLENTALPNNTNQLPEKYTNGKSEAKVDLFKAFFMLNELSETPEKYFVPSSNSSSRPFWKQIVESGNFPEFGSYSGETLRSYYRVLKETKNFRELYKLATINREFIDKTPMKWLVKQIVDSD